MSHSGEAYLNLYVNSVWTYILSDISSDSKSSRKHAYSNTLKISQPKTENFQIRKSDIFHISVQNIDCGYSFEPPQRGGSNEYQNLCFERK